MTKQRPNILLITSDQQHWSTLGAINPKISTPNLDRLCREGTRFSRAYCNSPVCSPSRSTIITGQYPSWHGCWTIGAKLPEDVPTIGSTLSAAGYATTLIGKAHFQPLASDPGGGQESLECQPKLRDLEFWRSFTGPWYGFNHVEVSRNHTDESHVGQHYALWLEERGLTNWRDYFQPWPSDSSAPRRQHSWDLPQKLHYTTWTAERSIAAINTSAEAGRPFFLWASFHDPHPSYLVPEPWSSMYDPADMLRLPFIARWPEYIPAGTESAALQSLVDLAPTFLAASGLPVPGVMQGVNQLPVWSGEAASVREMVVTEFRRQPTAVHLRSYIGNRYKITVYRDQDYGELFDLETDPEERCNLWDDAEHAEIRAEMLRKSLNAEIVGEPMRLPRIAHA